MLVKYIKCDICGETIPPTQERYRYSYIVKGIENTLGDPREEKLDVCFDCCLKMKQWIREQKGAKDATNT